MCVGSGRGGGVCVCACVRACVRACMRARARVCVCLWSRARARALARTCAKHKFSLVWKGISTNDSNILLLCAIHRSSLSTLLCFKCELGRSTTPSLIRPFVRSFVRVVVSVNVSLLVRTEITRGSVEGVWGFRLPNAALPPTTVILL